MSLLHALVAHNATTLAESSPSYPSSSSSSSNNTSAYASATQSILARLPDGDRRLSYAAGEVMVHYQKKESLVVMVVADEDVSRRQIFAFLLQLQQAFTSRFSAAEIASAPAYGMASFSKDIEKLMHAFEEHPPEDAISNAREELEGVKQIMTKNIDAVLSRGERIDLLVGKTDELSTQSIAFRKRSKVLRRQMWWKSQKMLALIGLVVLLIIYFLVASACGLTLSSCRS